MELHVINPENLLKYLRQHLTQLSRPLHGFVLLQDLPKDPTGRFHDFEDFVDSNFDVFQWLIFFIIMAQIFSFLLALALRSANWDSNYHSDEDLQVRYPLINNHPIQPPPYVIGIPPYVSKTDAGPL